MPRTSAILIAFLIFSTGACADAAPPAEDDAAKSSSLNVQIGRFGVINEQARGALDFVKGKTPQESDPDRDLYTAKGLYRRLYRSVIELNLIIVDGCEVGVLVDEQCNTLWRDWLKFPGQESYTLGEIQTYADDIQQAEVLIWSALCDAAKKKGADEHFCAIE